MGLSTLEIAQLRADQGDYLPDTCTLQTVSRVKDAVGGWADSWTNTYTSIACRVAPVSAQGEKMNAEQLASVTGWVLTVAHNQTLNATMRCIHGGNTYEIASVKDTHSNRTARRALLRRIG